MRNFSVIDQVLSQMDRALYAMFAKPKSFSTEEFTTTTNISEDDKKRSARLMRVNHAGEMAAQGLYRGHMLTARDAAIKQQLSDAAAEEQTHLSWCNQRLEELNDQPSVFDPAWYLGSFAIGATVGLLGDKWTLGFISETEKQVVKHLDKHLERLPDNDHASREILLKMRDDEAHHDRNAQNAGAEELPAPAKLAMHAVSKIMTKTSYWI